jgi:hypothetical protein
MTTLWTGSLDTDFSGSRAQIPALFGLGSLDSERVPWTTEFQVGPVGKKECQSPRRNNERSRLHQPSITERKEPPVAKYHVVEHSDTKHLAGFLEPARDFLIFLTWTRFAARVVVNKNHSSRTKM